eukprot:4142597-Pyramimonas_sp.AAC.1
MTTELATSLSVPLNDALLDTEKLFGSLCTEYACNVAVKHAYPAVPLVSSMGAHATTSALTSSFGRSAVIRPTASILHGCCQSASSARAILQDKPDYLRR